MKIITLTNGLPCLVDDDVFDRLAAFTWYPKLSGSGKITYSIRYVGHGEGRRIQTMVCDIVGSHAGRLTDHKNRNGLDNRRENLRLATRRQNQANRTPAKGRRFKGTFPTSCGFFARCAGKYLGHFGSEPRAAMAYNIEAQKAFGEFAYLNTFTAGELEALQEIQ